MEFCASVKAWSDVITSKSMQEYKRKFNETSHYFENRLKEAGKQSGELIKLLAKST